MKKKRQSSNKNHDDNLDFPGAHRAFCYDDSWQTKPKIDHTFLYRNTFLSKIYQKKILDQLSKNK